MRRAFLIRALSAVVSLQAFASEPPPTNGADLYKQGMAWWIKARDGETPLLSSDEENGLSDGMLGGAPTALQLSGYAKVKPFIDFMRQGSQAPNCDFKLDYPQGFGLLLPHLSPMRSAARLLRFDVQMKLRDGDVERAMESLTAISGMARHSLNDRMLISSLVSGAVLGLQDRVIDQAIGEGAIDSKRAEALLHEFESLNGNDPLHMSDALRLEGDVFMAEIRKSVDTPEGLARLRAITDGEAVDDDALAKLTPEQLKDQVGKSQDGFLQLAEAMANPDRDAARRSIADIEAAVERGDMGELAKLLIPSVSRCAEASWRVQDMLAARRAQLEEIRSGRASPDSLANAAVQYLEAARLAMGLPEEQERDIETARVASNALDADTQEKARGLVAPSRRRLPELFRAAGRRPRCDFAILNGGPRPQLVPLYLGALRGTARIELADALLGASKRGADGRVAGSDQAPVTPGEAIGWTMRLARHLASDSGIGHSVISAALLRDAQAALDEALPRHLITSEEAVALQSQLDAGNRSDPCGFRRAVKTGRELVRERLLGQAPVDDGNRSLDDAVTKRDATAVAEYLLILQLQLGEFPPGMDRQPVDFSPEMLNAPLTGAADLLAVDSMKAARATIDAWKAEWLANPQDGRRVLRSWVNLSLAVPPCDITVREREGAEAFARIEALLSPLLPKS